MGYWCLLYCIWISLDHLINHTACFHEAINNKLVSFFLIYSTTNCFSMSKGNLKNPIDNSACCCPATINYLQNLNNYNESLILEKRFGKVIPILFTVVSWITVRFSHFSLTISYEGQKDLRITLCKVFWLCFWFTAQCFIVRSCRNLPDLTRTETVVGNIR